MRWFEAGGLGRRGSTLLDKVHGYSGGCSFWIGEGAHYYPWRSDSSRGVVLAASGTPRRVPHPNLDRWLWVHRAFLHRVRGGGPYAPFRPFISHHAHRSRGEPAVDLGVRDAMGCPGCYKNGEASGVRALWVEARSLPFPGTKAPGARPHPKVGGRRKATHQPMAEMPVETGGAW